MANLSVRYLGLELKNPIVVAASGLTSTVDGVRKAADGGAGAIVLKSLFEEQLRAETDAVGAVADLSGHPEAVDFLESMGVSGGTGEYLSLVRSAVSAVKIPVIASVNCATPDRWMDFAEQVASAGASALELNLGAIPRGAAESSDAIENSLVKSVAAVRSKIRLPIAVKLGASYTNLRRIAQALADAGAGALVLFNRFYRLDVDLASMSAKSGPTRSSGEDYHEALRWSALLYGRVPLQIAAGGGVRSGETALKLIAAGASVIQVCSGLYEKGYGLPGVMAEEMSKRLDELGIPSVGELRGRVAASSSVDGAAWERLQYVKALVGIN